MKQPYLIGDLKLSAIHQAGFSMIEMMIAVAILAIVTAVALPSYTKFIANTQIRSTAESIKNGLQLARAEAVKRNAQVTFTLADDTSWELGCTIVDDDNCPAVIQSKAANEGSAGNINVELQDSDNIVFTSLGTVAPIVGQLSQIDIDHETLASDDTRNLRVMIGAGGNIRMCDPNILATDDTRKC